MRVPRIYARKGFFWVAFFLPGEKYAIKRSTHIRLDIPPIKGQALPWKKSKHRADLEAIIGQVESYRHRIIMEKEWGIKSEVHIEDIPRLEELMKEYTKVNRQERGKKSERTIERRSDSLKFIRRFQPDIELPGITRKFVLSLREWAEENGYAAWSIHGYFADLKALWRYCKREKYLPHDTENPFEGILIKIPAKKHRDIDIRTEYDLYSFIYKWDKPLFYQVMFLRLTGFRVSDSCTFTTDRIQKQNINYFNNKADREEVMPISDAMKYFLSLFKPSGKYLFKYQNRTTVGHYLAEASKLAGIEHFNPHLLKALYAKELLQERPKGRVMDALMHHAPEDNKIAMKHYTKSDREELLSVLNPAQRHWVKFLQGLNRGKRAGVPVIRKRGHGK